MNKMHGERGFTLVEVMVALVIGLVLITGVAQIYSSNKQAYLIQEETARVQENARFATDIIAREIRMAGYRGCYAESNNVANTVNGAAGNQFLNLKEALRGFEGGASTFPSEISATVKAGTDAILSLRGSTDDSLAVTSHNPNSAVIHLAANHSIKKGEILVVSDCQNTAVFQQTTQNNNNNISHVGHNTGTGTPGNCNKKNLGAREGLADCDHQGGLFQYTFGAGASLMRLISNLYYIRPNVNGVPSLYRLSLNGASPTNAEELIEGVEDMQIVYGYDPDGDGSPNRYVPADKVADWDKAVSVRISMLFRSIEPVSPAPQKYTFNGTTVTPTDRYARRVYTSTIKIRNRGLR